jgi:hypothetical protein
MLLVMKRIRISETVGSSVVLRHSVLKEEFTKTDVNMPDEMNSRTKNITESEKTSWDTLRCSVMTNE